MKSHREVEIMNSKMVQTERGTMEEKLPENIEFSQVVKISKEKQYNPHNDYTVPPELLDCNSCQPCFVLWNSPNGLALTCQEQNGFVTKYQDRIGAEEFQTIVDTIIWE